MFNREHPFISVFRSFPDSIKIVFYLNYVANPSSKNLFLMLLFFTGTLTTFTLKKIIKFIYTFFKVKKLPILGIGHRPPGASSCSTQLTIGNKLSKTFGMPSGHSQMAWIFASFFIFKIWKLFNDKNDENDENDENDNDDKKKPYLPFYQNYNDKGKVAIKVIQTLLLLLFAVFMSYTRVFIEKCHTIQQVIFGAITGISIGLLGSYLYMRLEL
tara:strand:+ start:28 stop:669 length:642 start_codon:yes stop_codon:yes gene_type:complete